MVTNEVFIDSATLRENVVALARNIWLFYFNKDRGDDKLLKNYDKCMNYKID